MAASKIDPTATPGRPLLDTPIGPYRPQIGPSSTLDRPFGLRSNHDHPRSGPDMLQYRP